MKKLIILFLTLVSITTMAQVSETENKIKNKILKLNPYVPKKELDIIATRIDLNSRAYNINPDIFISIMMQESSFSQRRVSSTGDISIAQINYKIWSKELRRLKLRHLDQKMLKTNIAYSIDTMGVILNYLRNKYPKDPHWFARYHSSNNSHKLKYFRLVNRHSKQIANL